jgi:hypothetical protein
LDEYRNTNDYGVILALKNMDCACKEAWRSAMEAPVGEHLKTRVARAYEAIGREVLGPSWWDTYGGSLLADLTAS